MRNLMRMSVVMLALLCTVAVMAAGQNLSSQLDQSPVYHTNPSCGDGIVTVEVGESCDPPGSLAGANDNVCRDDCTVCGDGILQEDAGEVCDDGDTDDFDECNNSCQVGPECGDGYIDYATGETCDPPGMPAPNGNDCREDCTFCGDGHVDMGEECDDGDTDDFDECSNSCVPPQVGGEGCTPGYWKNKLFAWEPTPYDPAMLVRDVFILPMEFDALGDETLRGALRWSSGEDPIDKAANLIKHAIASLLNASHPDVDFSWMAGDIIDAVNDALAGGDPGYMDDLHLVYDDANNSGCPLSGRPPRTDERVSRDAIQYLRTKESVGERMESRPVSIQRN